MAADRHSSDEAMFQPHEGQFRCSDCERRYIERANFNLHLILDHPRAPITYVCPYCGLEVGDFHLLHEHVSDRHRGRKVSVCELCWYMFWDAKALEVHTERHLEYRQRRTCRKCSQLFISRRELRAHKAAGHAWLREFECSICGSTFIRDYRQFREEQEALRRDGKTRRWVPLCARCGKIFSSKLNLNKHNCVDEPDEGRKPLCGECCSNGNGSKENILGQEKIEKNGQPNECDNCNEKFSKQKNLNGHKRFHEDSEPGFVCEKCRKIFSSMESLSKHRKTCEEPVAGPYHAPPQPLSVCDKCHKAFRSLESLCEHRKTCVEPVAGPSHAPD